MNQVILIGRFCKENELRYTQAGKAYCKNTIAVNRAYEKDVADFFNVTIWGKMAENTANYTRKGSQVAISGRVQNNNYETPTGEKRYSTEIVAERVEFLDSKKDNTHANTGDLNGFQAIEDDDEIPF